MFDILHRVGIKASPHDVYGALSESELLSRWWTNDTKGTSEIGNKIRFTFGDRGFFDMKVLELDPDKRIVWEVADGPQEWIGTNIIWELKPYNDGTTIRFKHQGWQKPVEFMHHCSTKWAMFLMSLKAMLETGKGTPFPDDVMISVDWD